MSRTLFIVNPAAANGQVQKRWPQIKAAVERAGLSFDVKMTAGPMDAAKIAAKALEDGWDTIVSVGGDGTLNEVLNGFFRDGQPINPLARLGVLSLGTGLDFVRGAGIPSELGESIRILKRGRTWKVDVGQIQYERPAAAGSLRYFLNVAGLGLEGETVKQVNETSKRLGGFISFLWGTLVALVRYSNRQVRLEIDGMVRYQGKCTMIAVANSKYFGGGMMIAPNAALDDGRLDIIIVDGVSKLEILKTFPKLYRGEHLSHPAVYVMHGSRIKATSAEKVLVDADGEQSGQLNVEFTLLPKALNLIC
ncbi:MAG: diacylglycerol/lipid kinase family protein [Solirubrobacterales bacterium]